MFSWDEYVYDNDWISISDSEGIGAFYLYDSGVAISKNMLESTIRNPKFADNLIAAFQTQRETFSKEGITKRHNSRFKFRFQYLYPEAYSIFQLLEGPFLDEGETGRQQKLYHEWYFDEQVKQAREAGRAESDAMYMDTIESLKLQVHRLNKVIQQDKAIDKGGAREMIETLLEKSRKEHDQQMAELRREKAELEKLRQYSDYGYVYLFHDAETGMYKIGKSKNPDNRLSQVRTSTANNIVCFCTIETHEMTTLEAELHQQFAAQRIRGEWFNLTDADVQCIKERV